MFNCREDSYPPHLPYLAYEAFSHIATYSKKEPLFNLFDCLDEGSWKEHIVNHVTYKILLQVGLQKSDKSKITVLQNEPVVIEEVK